MHAARDGPDDTLPVAQTNVTLCLATVLTCAFKGVQSGNAYARVKNGYFFV